MKIERPSDEILRMTLAIAAAIGLFALVMYVIFSWVPQRDCEDFGYYTDPRTGACVMERP